MGSRGRTVVIAGGTGLLGTAIVHRAVRAGYRPVTLSRRTVTATNPFSVAHISCDATSNSELSGAFERIASEFLPVRAVVNCIGCNVLRSVEEYSEAELHRILDVNLYAAIAVSQHAIRLLKASGGGQLVHVSSQAGLDGQPFNTAYSAAKAGVVGLTKALAREVAPMGISVLAVCPGDIDSPMMDEAMTQFAAASDTSQQRMADRLQSLIPAGRMGTAAEVAEVVVQLLQIETTFLTGAAIIAAGGRTCH